MNRCDELMGYVFRGLDNFVDHIMGREIKIVTDNKKPSPTKAPKKTKKALPSFHFPWERKWTLEKIAMAANMSYFHLKYECGWLDLRGTGVNDISALAECPGLHLIHLDGLPISDISGLRKVLGLQQLYLKNTDVSDLSPLYDLDELSILDITGTNIGERLRKDPGAIADLKMNFVNRNKLRIVVDGSW